MHSHFPEHDTSAIPDQTGERLRYLELGPTDRQQLTELASALLPHLEGVLLEWHEFLRSHPVTSRLLGGNRGSGHLLAVQQAYFRTLLTAEPNAAYFAERARVGRVHHQVRLGPFWYLGAYRKFLELVRGRLLALGHQPAIVSLWSAALEKMVTLDLALALDAYQEREQAALRHSNRELERQMVHAREAAQLKEEFLSRVTHELHTPLHAMLGFADLVADGIQGPVTAEQRESLAKVRAHGERMAAMVDQLIAAAKLSAAATPEPEPFDPAPLLEEAVVTARDAAASKGLEFHSEVPDPLPWILGERCSFAEALRQLLDNAVRFTPAGGVRLIVARRVRRLHLAVCDSGGGIPPDQTRQIFDPFHQVDRGDRRSCRGIGMGLTLAREAIQRSGGTLELEQSGPEGSTFTIELPLAPRIPGHPPRPVPKSPGST